MESTIFNFFKKTLKNIVVSQKHKQPVMFLKASVFRKFPFCFLSLKSLLIIQICFCLLFFLYLLLTFLSIERHHTVLCKFCFDFWSFSGHLLIALHDCGNQLYASGIRYEMESSCSVFKEQNQLLEAVLYIFLYFLQYRRSITYLGLGQLPKEQSK